MIERLARSGAVWIIATLRSDLLPLLESSPPLMRLASDERLFRVKSPSRFALRDMVARPAAEAGLTFKGHNSAGVSLEDILVDDAAHLADSLPLLQFALSRLYEQRERKSGALTVEDYARFGSLEGAIGRYAEEQTVEAFGQETEMTRAVEDIIVALARFDRESGAAVGRTTTFEVHDSSPNGRAIATLAKARRHRGAGVQCRGGGPRIRCRGGELGRSARHSRSEKAPDHGAATGAFHQSNPARGLQSPHQGGSAARRGRRRPPCCEQCRTWRCPLGRRRPAIGRSTSGASRARRSTSARPACRTSS
ncbi:nSTAND1 domain-containing NTPase [Lichenifustis flavocetrariae]|uniref:nSTAND1 domain-containing NTPase n=1 Tax=Lichenifustis flavocetrariae TaxID=2949735 RepID=UPI003D0ADB03